MNNPDVFSWEKYEEILYKALDHGIKRFAALHPEEVFAGICFDANADYAQFGLAFGLPDEVGDGDISEQCWDVGDWEYLEANIDLAEDDPVFRSLWKEQESYLKTKISDKARERWEEGENPLEDFMFVLSKVAIRLENSEAIQSLKKTEQFRIIAVDHDEYPEQEGLARINKVAAELKLK